MHSYVILCLKIRKNYVHPENYTKMEFLRRIEILKNFVFFLLKFTTIFVLKIPKYKLDIVPKLFQKYFLRIFFIFRTILTKNQFLTKKYNF